MGGTRMSYQSEGQLEAQLIEQLQSQNYSRIEAIVEYDILPMLSEYWFDDMNKLQRWENILRGVFQ